MSLTLLAALALSAAPPSGEGVDLYQKTIRPALVKHCFACHSAEAKKNRKLRAALLVDTRDGLLAGGESGPAIVPGKPEQSLLLKAIRHDGLDMPPSGDKLPAALIADFERWVKRGAPFPTEAKTSVATVSPEVKKTAPAVQRGVAAIARHIDTDIETKLSKAGLKSAALSDDAEFLRRVYLDITGRVPSAEQAVKFLDDQSSDKRAKLIDDLLASGHHGEQFGRVWRDWIAPLELPSEGNGGNQPIKATKDLGKWFSERFNKGDGWDKIVRQVLTTDGTLKEQPQGLFFSLVGDDQGRPQPGGTARAIGTLFLGVRMECAQCHDDPFKEWKQADFWGMAAFFRNTRWTFQGRYFASVTESFETPKGGRNNAVAPDKSRNGAITIPKEAFKNAGQVIPAKLLGSDPLAAQDRQLLRPIFTDWLVSKDNPYFARAFVNRTWAYFFGRGLLNPIDDFRDDNKPTHPEVLDALTQEFVASGFDVKHLIRCMTTTRAYQRTSKPGKNRDAETVAAFGRISLKVMSADALYDSLRLALADPSLDLRSYDAKLAQRFGESSPTGDAYDEFVRLFATNRDDATDFTHGIPQLLALINHPRLKTGGKTVETLLKGTPEPEKVVESLYLTTLSRRPTSEELAETKEFVTKSKDRRRAYNGVLWTLLNRTEFLLIR